MGWLLFKLCPIHPDTIAQEKKLIEQAMERVRNIQKNNPDAFKSLDMGSLQCVKSTETTREPPVKCTLRNPDGVYVVLTESSLMRMEIR